MTQPQFWPRVLILIATGSLVLIGHGLTTHRSVVVTGDYITFLAAGKGLRQGVDIYDDASMSGLWSREFNLRFSNRYIYPPLFATIMSTVADLPRQPTFEGYGWVNLALTGLLAGLLLALLRQLGFRQSWMPLLVLAALSYNVALQRTLIFSQVNLIVLDAILGSMLAIRRFPVLSALLLCLAVNIKMAPVLLLLPFVLARAWRWLAWFAAFQVLFVLVTVVPYGLEPWHSFIEYTTGHLGMPIARNSSVDSFILLLGGAPDRLSDPGSARLQILVVKALVLVGVGAIGLRTGLLRLPTRWLNDSPPDRVVWIQYAMLFLMPLMLLVSPFAWPHGHIFVLPPALVVFLNQRTWWGRLICALAYGSIFWAPVSHTFPTSFHRTISLLVLCLMWIPSMGEVRRLRAVDARQGIPAGER